MQLPLVLSVRPTPPPALADGTSLISKGANAFVNVYALGAMSQVSATIDRTSLRQKIAFWLALFDFIAVSCWFAIRFYFAVAGDDDADRRLVLNPHVLQLLPIVVLIWIIGFVTVGNSIVHSRRLTSYGLSALVLLAIPAAPLALKMGQTFWKFMVSP